MTERYADRGKRGPPTQKQLQEADLEAYAVARALNGTPNFALWNAAQAATEAASGNALRAAQNAAVQAAHSFGRRVAVEYAAQASLLRCLLGNPLRPSTLDASHRLPAEKKTAIHLSQERIGEEQESDESRGPAK